MESQEHGHILDKEWAPYLWMIWIVLAMKGASLNVHMMNGAEVIVDMMKMLASFVQ